MAGATRIWLGFASCCRRAAEIRRVADQRELAARAFPDQVADDDEASRNADAHFQARHALEGQFRNKSDAFQRGLDSALGAVLVRGGKSEIG